MGSTRLVRECDAVASAINPHPVSPNLRRNSPWQDSHAHEVRIGKRCIGPDWWINEGRTRVAVRRAMKMRADNACPQRTSAALIAMLQTPMFAVGRLVTNRTRRLS